MAMFKCDFGNWINFGDLDSDIVISSRIRLARNISNFVFPHWANETQLNEVRDFISGIISQSDSLKDLVLIFSEKLVPQEKDMLVENHLISPAFSREGKGQAFIISEKIPNLCIMVNEEDHLRIQVFSTGLKLREAWKIADETDDRLSSHLPYAFSKQWGYLTECPANAGNAMKASVVMQLPALVINDEIESLFSNLSDSNVEVRGLFGEDINVAGDFFQISNQSTLGKSEDEIINNLEVLLKKIIERERAAREILLKEDKIRLLDEISRSWGILTHAKLISFEEAVDHLSMLCLGVDLNLLSDLSRSQITELMTLTGPAHLRNLMGEDFDDDSEDIARAELIKRELYKLREGAV
ncbi:MAG TPA: ATP--guanido phosphotransferase [Actinobacteria bacterium]|nr:ATP--guanido phosphotransferase [Actinomycetota bacterium]